MSAKDTTLLGEILSVQKALLKALSKKDSEGEGEGEGGQARDPKTGRFVKSGGGAASATGSFTEVLESLTTLNDTSKKQLEVLERIDKNTAGGGGMGGGKDSGTSSLKGGKKDLGEIGESLVGFSMGIIALVGGIALMALVLPLVPMAMLAAVGIGLIVLGFSKLFEYIGSEESAEKVKRANENLFGMAKGLGLFVLVVIGASLAIGAIGFAAIGMTALVIIGFAGVFYLLGMGAEKIKDGAMSAAYMGLGMASIGLGVLVLVLSLKFAGDVIGSGGGSVLIGGLAAIGIIAVSAAIFVFVGAFKTEIIAGALAVAAIGLGLAAFGLGLTVYLSGIAKVMGVGGEGIVGGTAVTGGFFDTLGTMLVGLGVIAAGAMALILYGTIFALAGQAEFGVPEMIMFGALAMAAVALSLLFFGFGLDYYLGVIAKNSGVSGEGKDMEISEESFKSGMTVNFGALGMLIGFGAIFALAGAVSPLIGLGAAAFSAVGLALNDLGIGLQSYSENASGVDIGDGLKKQLIDIRDALFAFVGEDDAASGGIFSSIGSLISGSFKAGTLNHAISSAMLLGPALSSIAQGLMPWANVTQAPKFTGYDENGQPIYDKKETVNILDSIDNIGTALPLLVQPFIDLSNTANLSGDASILSILTGVQFGNSAFTKGVAAAGGIGPVLSGLAQGIGAFASLTRAPKITGFNEMGQPIYDKTDVVNILDSAENIGTAIEAVIDPFIVLGAYVALLGTANASLLSLVTGVTLGTNPFTKGVNAAGSIGPVLSGLAQGIGAFASLTQAPKFTGYDDKGQPIYDKTQTVNMLDSADNIGTAIEAVIQPFIDLANNAALLQEGNLITAMTGIQLGQSPFARGVGIAGQIGAVLSSMAVGIGNFADLKQAKKIIGYTKDTGQPIFSESEIYDITASIDSLAELLSTDGNTSIIRPFIDLANSAANEKPWSIVGFFSQLSFGTRPGTSPLMSGIELGLQIGMVLSSIAGGLGIFANLTAIPTITGTDEKGQPIYGKPTDASTSISNFGIMVGDLITEFATAGESLGPYTDFTKTEGIGPAITGIMGGVVSAIDVFSNPNKLKMIESYDKNGKPVYSQTKFVSVDSAVGNMIYTIKRILMAFGTESMADIMDNLDIDEDEMIGDYLNTFIKPIQGFVKIAGELAVGSMSITSLADEIIYASVEMVTKFAELDPIGIKQMGLFSDLFEEFGEVTLDVYEDLLDFDVTDPDMYRTTENFSGSALIGVGTNLRVGLGAIIDAFVLDHVKADFVLAEAGAKSVKKVLGDIKSFPSFMSGFMNAKPEEFGKAAKAAYDGLYTITQVATKGDGKGKTHMMLFTDQISRLAGMATPFERFTKAFAHMANDMGKFANNFKIMNVDSLHAFKGWTSALVDLSTADPNSFAANVVTTIKAIDAGLGLVNGNDGNDGDKPPVKGPPVTPDPKNPNPAGGLTANAIREAFREALLETVVLTKEMTSAGFTKKERITKR